MTTARDLTVRLTDLLRREHDAMADFLVALADFDRRRAWVELGYSSLFYFLVRELGLSKGAAQYRKTAAELVRRIPEIVEPLRDGRLCLTSVVELAHVLTPENRDQVLPRFFGLSRKEAAAVVAELQPVETPPRRDVVTVPHAPASRLPPAEIELQISPVPPSAQTGSGWLADLPGANSPTEERVLLPQRRTGSHSVEPLTADLRRFHLTVSRGFLEKLEAARDALSHTMPHASTEHILEAGLDLLLAGRAKKNGLVAKPRTDPRPSDPDSDHIPASVKRAVAKRDGGRCQWALASGGICGSTRRIEFAHRIARAHGGGATVENIRQLCRFHNEYEARLQLGDAVMDRFTRKRTPTPSRSAAGETNVAEQPSLGLRS